MPAYLSFTRKNNHELVAPRIIDDEMRVYFQREPSENEWMDLWYSNMGHYLATGTSLDDVVEKLKLPNGDNDYSPHVEFLKKNYDVHSSYSRF